MAMGRQSLHIAGHHLPPQREALIKGLFHGKPDGGVEL